MGSRMARVAGSRCGCERFNPVTPSGARAHIHCVAGTAIGATLTAHIVRIPSG
jgi:hypothetical protein